MELIIIKDGIREMEYGMEATERDDNGKLRMESG